MDEQRKHLVTSGVEIGDITLALAGLAAEIPPWAADLDLAKYVSEAGADGVARQVEQLLSGADAESPDPEGANAKALATALGPRLAELTADRAIARGKFLSATRCLEIMDRKDEYVAKYLAAAQKAIGQGDLKQAGEALVTASNLELNEGTPLFQYTGPALHEGCTSSRDKCVTALPGDAAVLVALQYLLGGAKACEAIGALSAEARRELLPFVAQARDPEAATFYKSYKQAQADLEAIEKGEMAALREDLKRLSTEIATFAGAIGSASSSDIESRDALERVLRNAASLKKEFGDIENLVGALQLRRIRRRLEQVVESRSELADARDALKKGSGLAASIGALLDLVDDLTRRGILEGVDALEEKIVATQVTLLGRAVHSQEHWQYLRELAFKYPVSAIMCCVKRVNAKWMVVPAWQSEVAVILRRHLDTP